MSLYDLSKLLYEARVREAWGAYADNILSRAPFPRHLADPNAHETHNLAIAQAKAVVAALQNEERAAEAAEAGNG